QEITLGVINVEHKAVRLSFLGLNQENFCKNCPTSGRKREFIPAEKKDDLYWERRRKNNEAARRSREKRRLHDMVLENKLIALREENATLKAELLSLKLRFGLVSSLTHYREEQGVSASLRLQHVTIAVSVIKNLVLSATPDECGIGGVTAGGASVTPYEAAQDCNAYALCQNYLGNTFHSCLLQHTPTSQTKAPTSVSIRTLDGEEGSASRCSDYEDKQRLPKGLDPSPVAPTSALCSVKVQDPSSSALPHKLRVKARSVQIKVAVINSNGDMPLSLQVAKFQCWAHRPERWRGDGLEAVQKHCRKEVSCDSPCLSEEELSCRHSEESYTSSAGSDGSYIQGGVSDYFRSGSP
uniref:Nuclear factor, interleukin 3 regulated n=1 Tax=Scleropages formosus TaxID=113540 RepID=A0A8C9SC55_SCLFO